MVYPDQIDEFVAWTKRRGIFWISSQIYGGVGSVYDYGPVGAEIKRKLKDLWWREIVIERDNVVGIDSAIILNSKVWEASGHLDKFTDPLVEDLKTGKRYRLDDLADRHQSPEGNPISEPIAFNTMFKTSIGSVEDKSSVAYLRPETCQGIFINYKQVVESSRLKLPFGIAQVGKAFRNEITTGNMTFRMREFEQMELEYFVRPEEADEAFSYWVDQRLKWYQSIGIAKERLRLRSHPKSDLAHYSKATTDIEYHYPWGWSELEGIANRGDYDLKQHQKYSGIDLMYFDEVTQRKFHPYVIEPSGGIDRTVLALLIEGWEMSQTGREGQGESEIILHIDPRLAAFGAAVFPLVKKEPLIKMASEITARLRQQGLSVFYDDSGSIGRRYRRQDEIGTPVCYTVDFQSLEDQKVTERNRDTMKQKRVKL